MQGEGFWRGHVASQQGRSQTGLAGRMRRTPGRAFENARILEGFLIAKTTTFWAGIKGLKFYFLFFSYFCFSFSLSYRFRISLSLSEVSGKSRHRWRTAVKINRPTMYWVFGHCLRWSKKSKVSRNGNLVFLSPNSVSVFQKTV